AGKSIVRAAIAKRNQIDRAFAELLPLNIICSRKCDLPVCPSSSFLEPTRYQITQLTIGFVWTSLVRMVIPLTSFVRRTFDVSELTGEALMLVVILSNNPNHPIQKVDGTNTSCQLDFFFIGSGPWSN